MGQCQSMPLDFTLSVLGNFLSISSPKLLSDLNITPVVMLHTQFGNRAWLPFIFDIAENSNSNIFLTS